MLSQMFSMERERERERKGRERERETVAFYLAKVLSYSVIL